MASASCDKGCCPFRGNFIIGTLGRIVPVEQGYLLQGSEIINLLGSPLRLRKLNRFQRMLACQEGTRITGGVIKLLVLYNVASPTLFF